MRAILTALTAILLLLPCSAHAQSVLRIGLNDDPDALDPTISRAYTGRLVFAALCDKLFDVTPDLKIVPQLATGYEWAADRKSIVIKLRPGVRFQDGEPFNAEAVKFNIERHQSTPGSFRKSEIGEIQSVDVVNDLTVRLNLSQPLVPLLAAFTDRAGMMVSPKAARALGDKLGTQPVCAGPYRFVQRVAQGKIVVERVADYWDKASFAVDRIEFVPITDSTSRLASLRSGDLHMIERVSPTDLPEIRGDARLKVIGVPELGYQMIPLNVANGPKSKALADARVRRAIDLAIDRETLTKTVFAGEYIPGNQFVSPVSPFYNAKVPVGTRDVARARQLLREAGQPSLAFTLIVPPERDRQEAALILQAMLAEAGITMTIQSQENVTMLQAGRRGDFEAYFTFWSGRPDPDGNIYSFTTCKGAQNDSHYCNPEIDALLTRARQVADPGERKKLYDQTTEVLQQRDVPRLILWHRRVFTGFSAKVQGFTPYPDGIIRFRGLRVN